MVTLEPVCNTLNISIFTISVTSNLFATREKKKPDTAKTNVILSKCLFLEHLSQLKKIPKCFTIVKPQNNNQS